MTLPSRTAPVLRRFLPLGLGLLAVGGVLGALLRPAERREFGTQVGQLAPPFLLSTLEGEEVDSARLIGQPLVLNFWGSNCVPCEREVPLLVELQQKRGQDLKLLGVVAHWTPDGAARNLAEQLGMTYPSLSDREGFAARAYQLFGTPLTYFIDRQGVVQQITHGELTRQDLATGLQRVGVEGM
ncbi:TlpA family protein disulfide reductase [Deinococcus sp. SDU3-2]|uniref:TlpA family protein disulfide reductase n=1 Tax=Deinococcus terrestris TaxID=2651870 RepID=A0A7X1NTF3_9DEIO|nr:TlpA disulfide reductase family protein [Deinococcus terrestris]MPY65512.1 TlpA family protein disulfide reductase [Deinococcus terrestris]